MSKQQYRLQGWSLAFVILALVLGAALSATIALAALPAGSASRAAARANPQQVPQQGQGGVSASAPLSGCWTTLNTPNVGSGGNYLKGGAAVSASDQWAVGYYTDTSGAVNSLIEHGVNNNWSVVPAANLGTHINYLQGVTAISANDVWAVGGVITASLKGTSQARAEPRGKSPGTGRPGPPRGNGTPMIDVPEGGNIVDLLEHWNGSNWIAVQGVFTSGLNYIQGIAAGSTNNVWAVGYNQNYQTITQNWHDGLWHLMPSPNVGTMGTFLQSVSISGPNSAWAAGSFYTSTNVLQNFVIHYNGTSWQVDNPPNIGTSSNYLTSISTIPGQILVVGNHLENGVWEPLAEDSTDDGETWTDDSPTFDQKLERYFLDGLVLQINHFVGEGKNTFSPPSDYRPLVEDWNGTTWNDNSPLVHYDSEADAVAAFGFDAYELYGIRLEIGLDRQDPNAAVAQTLIMRYDNPCGGPTPVPTNTPGGPTATRTTAPTQTPGGPTATPACTIQFSDVPVGSTFYPYIHCLACLGIINGYADGTFKPNANVTRGQLSKIVSNAARFTDPQPTQLFQDVPVGSTFQLYVGRLASRGYIGGYPCGGAGEPCVPPGNLPYFRPNNQATRGQISKIDANAAGYNDTPTGQQFQDVPTGSTYYTYTYRLVSRSVMSGYPCGGGGEPCVPPANLPYFRPNANATRGQTSKIVGNTFFPDCNP